MGVATNVPTMRIPAWLINVFDVFNARGREIVSPSMVTTHPVFNFYFRLRKLLQVNKYFDVSEAVKLIDYYWNVQDVISIRCLTVEILEGWFSSLRLPVSKTLSDAERRENISKKKYIHGTLYSYVFTDLQNSVTNEHRISYLIRQWKSFAGLNNIVVTDPAFTVEELGNGVGKVTFLVDNVSLFAQQFKTFARQKVL